MKVPVAQWVVYLTHMFCIEKYLLQYPLMEQPKKEQRCINQ